LKYVNGMDCNHYFLTRKPNHIVIANVGLLYKSECQKQTP